MAAVTANPLPKPATEDSNLHQKVNFPLMMLQRMPDDLNVVLLPTALLADDEILKRYEIHRGDEFMCQGFPHFVSSQNGYPIFRSGRISSYPLTPTAMVKSILFEFNVFDGNSGEPVQFVMGLVSQQLQAAKFNNRPIGVSVIIPAPFITETINSLPPTSQYK